MDLVVSLVSDTAYTTYCNTEENSANSRLVYVEHLFILL